MHDSESVRLILHALDAITEGILITGPAEQDCPIIYANATAERLTGYTRPELLGKNCRLLQGQGTDAGELQRVALAIRDGQPVSCTVLNYRRDGTCFWNRLTISPVRGVDGRVSHFIGVVEDASARVSLDAQLKRSVRQYRLLMARAPYGIYVLDPAGLFIELNDAAASILGRAVDDVRGLHFASVVVAEDLPRAEDVFTRVISGRENDVELELCIARPGGEKRHLVLTVSAAQDESIRALFGIARDVTEERAREQHLRRVERLASVGTLIAGVAHELNNPLSAIRGFAQILLMEVSQETDREALEVIQRESERAAKIVADLRALVRESQAERRSRESVDLNDVVRHVLRLREYEMRTHNIALRCDLAHELPWLTGTRGDLEQVVLNLIVNAEHALREWPHEPRIIVRTRPCRTGAALDVVDNGPGIAQEHLERIFDPFFTTKAPGEGTGLGLSLAHKIVTEHGGTLTVDSEVGRGAAFRIELPRALPAADPAPSRGPSPAAPVAAARRVLVVDDEAAIRKTLQRFLSRRGHRVDVAAEGGEAIRLLDQEDGAPYDVILSDLRMPGLGGAALLQLLRQRDVDVARHLVFITGDAEGLPHEGVRTVLKPFDLHEIATLVEATPRRT